MDRQLLQLERNAEWVKSEGSFEHPTRIDTLLQPAQVLRMAWLSAEALPSILEVGCSWGYVTAYIGGHAGVDLNPESIRIAQTLAPMRKFKVGDALDLPYEDNSYSTVMLPEILEHLDWDDVPRAISEAMRVSSYQVLVTVPNGDLDTEEALTPKHRYLMTFERLKDLFSMPTIDRVGPFYCVGAHA